MMMMMMMMMMVYDNQVRGWSNDLCLAAGAVAAALLFEALPRWEVVTFARAVTAAGATLHGNL